MIKLKRYIQIFFTSFPFVSTYLFLVKTYTYVNILSLSLSLFQNPQHTNIQTNNQDKPKQTKNTYKQTNPNAAHLQPSHHSKTDKQTRGLFVGNSETRAHSHRGRLGTTSIGLPVAVLCRLHTPC